jgi:hypothetical protein
VSIAKYLTSQVINAWFKKAYGLHMLFVSLLLSDFILLLVSVIIAYSNTFLGLVLFFFSFVKIVFVFVAFVLSYAKRSDQFLSGIDNLDPELVNIIYNYIKDKNA